MTGQEAVPVIYWYKWHVLTTQSFFTFVIYIVQRCRCVHTYCTLYSTLFYMADFLGEGGESDTLTVKISTEKSSPKQCIRRVESYLKDRKKSTKRAIKTRWPHMHSLFAFYSSLYLFFSSFFHSPIFLHFLPCPLTLSSSLLPSIPLSFLSFI